MLPKSQLCIEQSPCTDGAAEGATFYWSFETFDQHCGGCQASLQPPGSVCLCVCLCGSASSLCISLSMFGVLFLFFYVSDSMVMLPALMMTASGNSRQGLQCS